MQDPLLSCEAALFQEQFNRQPFLITHRLADHPLFALPRLLQLCRDLPEHRVEYNSGNLGVDQDGTRTPRNGLSPTETMQRIAECESWLALKNVEHDPEYRDLLQETLASFRDAVQDMNTLEGFIFMSSPHAVTPYHMDPEHNFLLQIHGTKQINVFDPRDRTVLSEEELETFYGGGKHRNMKFREHYQPKARVFDLMPGTGLHFPVTAPHWVKVGPDVSISFSVTFRSESSRRQSVLHNINRLIRGMGLTPSPVGRSRLRDDSKYLAYKAVRGVKKRILGRRIKRGHE